MIDIEELGAYVVEWVDKDPCSFLITVILAITPVFIASAVISRTLAKLIEAHRKQKRQQNHQENISKAKITKSD